MSDEPNHDHRCRTCKHWCAPYVMTKAECEELWACECPLPFWQRMTPTWRITIDKDGRLGDVFTSGTDGEHCEAYTYSYRRARLVKL